MTADCLPHQVSVHHLRNVGRCDHTYLHHIRSQYDALAHVTLFVKDTIAEHVHMGYVSKLHSFVARLPQPLLAVWGARSLMVAKPAFEMDEYTSDTCRNRFVSGRGRRKCYASDAAADYLRASVRPLRTWRRQMGIDPRSDVSSASAGAGYVFVPGGVFAASREAVRHTPLATYRNLEAEMSRGANLEAGHYMERSWMQAFGAADARRDFSNVRGSMVIYTVLTRAQAATYHARQLHRGHGASAAAASVSRRRRGRSTEALAMRAAAGGAAAAFPLARAPCNHSAFADALSGTRSSIGGSDRRRTSLQARIECVFFSDCPQLLRRAAQLGWRSVTLQSQSPSDGALLVRAPHRSAELTPYDYSCFVPPARVLNVPAVLEALSGHVMGAGAALLVVLQTVPTAASTMAPTIAELRASSPAEHVASMVIVRRQTHAARLVGDAWHAQATGSSTGTLSPLPQSVVTSTVAMLSPTDPATPLLLLPNEAHAHEWWEWWRCVAKGQGPESLTGKLRLSRCCKPTALLAEGGGARAVAAVPGSLR